MRRILTFVTVVAGGSLCFGLSSHDALALPSSTLSAAGAMPSVVENAQYYTRRQWRRRGLVVVPNAAATADPNVTVEADDDALSQGGLNPPIVAIVPVRPASCGEYRYWNGNRCVDARYNDPYLGPR